MLERKKVTAIVIVLSAVSMLALAGDGFVFKCQSKECGFRPTIIFGGGMLFEQAMGWCHQCKAFRTVQWSRPGAPSINPNARPIPQPKPLVDVWVPAIGQTRRIYKCPKCEGSFMEIRKPEELCCCPKCNRPGFKVDPTAPRLAVD